ncbi:hypothetical protein J1N35_022979 [Gossypium stocksii]|uniref:Uncharacterized protein n=1 Tax=Gossypium stocksii TaxID=47602 RepID=A0A9D3VHN8_9ROSI|nr:hypothetical protein J1N35_022979 [Gossypium stocksii]
MLAVTCLQFGGDGNEGGEGGEVVGSKCREVEGEGEGGEVTGSNVVRQRIVLTLISYSDVRVQGSYLSTIECKSSKEQFEAEILKEVDDEGLNDSVGREENGNKTEYFDSDGHGSILGSKDDDNIDVCRRRSRFPTCNPNSASSHFCIGMLFKDGEQFKFVIREKFS